MKLATCVVVFSCLLTKSVLAKETELAGQVQACGQISDSTARLACFDQLTTKQSSTRENPATIQLTAQQVDTFAKEHVEKTADEKANEILSISLTIRKLEKDVRGKWKISFDNGQKWQQKDTTKLKLKQGDKVILTKGALSSVFLRKENTNKRMKVKRLK